MIRRSCDGDRRCCLRNRPSVDEEAVVLVAAPDHPPARHGAISPESVATAEFLVAERGCTSQMLGDRFGQDVTGSAPVAMVTGSLGALRRSASNGKGIALLPPHLTAAADLDSADLVCLGPPSSLRPVGIEARWRSDTRPETRGHVAALVGLARRNTLRAAAVERPA